MQYFACSGLPSLEFFTTKNHIEGIAFGILPENFIAGCWLLDILPYTSWSIRPCFSSLYESIHT